MTDATTGNSEAASKKRRGRPRVVPDEMLDFMRRMYGDMTDRRLQDKDLEIEAATALGLLVHTEEELTDDARRLLFIANYPADAAGNKRAIKCGILAELGRLRRTHGEDMMRDVAEWICRVQPNAKGGVALVRRARLGRDAPGNTKDLAWALFAAIDRYQDAHPNYPLENALPALATVYRELKRNLEDRRGDGAE